MSVTIKKQKILIQTIINFFGYFSETGQYRLLQDLKRTKNQYLCFQLVDGKIIKSVSEIGVPTVKHLLKNINKQKSVIDQDIEWKKTIGKYQDREMTILAFKKILELSEIIFKETNNIECVEILMGQLKGNKSSIIRSLAQTKYQSSTPGKRLVGKQTKKSNNRNVGYVEEHVLPTKVFVKYFIEQIKNNCLRNINLNDILEDYFTVNLNTDDDYKLSQKGFKNTMPKDWKLLRDNPFVRYSRAGINIKTILPINPPVRKNDIKPKDELIKIDQEKSKKEIDNNRYCEIALKKTYFTNDFFNFKTDLNPFLGESNSQIKIEFNNNYVLGIIDRKANNFRAPRVRNIGNEYKDWIKGFFNLNDTLFIKIINPNHIKLFHENDLKL